MGSRDLIFGTIAATMPAEHGDGSVLTYGGNFSGQYAQTKRMSTGVTCEGIVDFKSKQFKVSSPPRVQELISEKGLTALYDEWKQAILKHEGTLGTFSWPKVQRVVDDFQSKFNEKGVKSFLCNLRVIVGGQAGDNSVDFVKWFELVDMAKQTNYVPAEIYDPSKDACCTCVIS